MPSNSSDILNLPYIQPAQAQKHVTHNEALAHLDVLVQLVVTSRAISTPPTNPGPGKRYIVAPGASGDWNGHVRDIAVRTNGDWHFIEAQRGWRAYVQDEDQMIQFDGNDWVTPSVSGQNFQNLGLLGVNGTADTTNRLTVRSDAALFNHDGGDCRVKVNKGSGAATASMVFQTGFTGHAELGLAGDNRFSIRASSDGTSFLTAMEVASTTGLPTLPQGMHVTGPVTGSGIVGTVNASGGAIIETGSTANGRYVRFADGTQICTCETTLTKISDSRMSAEWTYPKDFLTGEPVAVAMSFGSSYSITPSVPDLGWMGGRVPNGAAVENTVSLRLYRRNGGVDFGAADAATVYAVATGRWN